MRGLEGKVAVVTGAARHRGIGRAIALRLAEEGCDVALTGYQRRPDAYPEAEQEMGWRGVASVVEFSWAADQLHPGSPRMRSSNH